MLEISPEKVARIIIRAREYDAKIAPWDSAGDEDREEQIEAILESTANDPIAAELTSYIDDLNVDEQVSLVAILWIGRGSYEAEDLAEAMETARAERVNKTSTYLLGIPLLADHLESGLEKLGHAVSDLENDLL